MLFKRPVLDAIAAGEIDLAFRRFKRPTVRAGGTLRTAVGVLAIDAVEPIDEADVTDAEARRAGCASRAELLAGLRREGRLYRIALHLAGPDPRLALRQETDLTAADVAELDRRLACYDAASRRGPWTETTLKLIADHPATGAVELARRAGVEKKWFKTNVRKLKALGLTESLRRGYRLSPRGRSFLAGRHAREGT